MSDQSLPRLDHLIDGAIVAPGSGQYIAVENPANGETIARVASGTAEDVDAAVLAARRAFEDPSWREMGPAERSRLLYRLVEIFTRNAEELVYLEALSTGGTIDRIATMDVMSVIEIGNSLAEMVTSHPFIEELPMRKIPEPVQAQIRREPVGVCALITAWNFPLLQFACKSLTALAAGNTAVVKPPELAPNSSLRLAELWSAGLPPGVLNVVNGTGPIVGDAMSAHPDIDKISFTGSTAVGRRIQQRAAQTIKRVTLELGGKGPAIVRADADLAITAYGALWGFLMNSGQACESGTRLIVHDSIREPLLARMRTIAAELKLGNPLEPGTSISPLCHAVHGEKVLAYVESALDEGARLVCGGERVAAKQAAGKPRARSRRKSGAQTTT
jgi:aldehyde dehydrogenase (NAD+)